MEIGQKSLMQKENRLIKENEISIHEFEDGYSFTDNLKSIFYSKSSLTKKKIKKKLESINLNKNKLSLVSFSKQSNLIPFIVFDEDLKETYFQKNSLKGNDFKTCFDIINSNDIVNLYRLNVDETLFKFFSIKKTPIISHYKTLILNTLTKINKVSLKKNIVYINLQLDSYDIFYFIENQFNYSNSFNINNTEEFLYYFFYFAEQFNLNPDSFSIVFLGKFNSFENHYTGIRDFQTDISFISNPTNDKDYINNHPAPFLANIFC
tara:strand:- start:619 stop:1410 length:792 start_codon:yes stop_codon:yes gene_type:complete